MQLQIDFDTIVLPHLYTISITTYYCSGPILYWMFIMFNSRLRYNYYTSIISIYQVCCLYSFLFFSFFFYCTVRKFFILCTIFLGLLMKKNCTFFAIKIRQKRFLGVFLIFWWFNTVWQKFLKLHLCYSNLVAKICLSKYSYSPPPLNYA